MDVNRIKANVLDLLPVSGGGYLTTRVGDSGAKQIASSKHIPGFKILLVRQESVPFLREDPTLWNRIINVGAFRTYTFGFFMEQPSEILDKWDQWIRDGTKKTKNGLLVVQVDTPHLFLGFLATVGGTEATEKKWWQFWK